MNGNIIIKNVVIVNTIPSASKKRLNPLKDICLYNNIKDRKNKKRNAKNSTKYA